jgi:hypothetical protein
VDDVTFITVGCGDGDIGVNPMFILHTEYPGFPNLGPAKIGLLGTVTQSLNVGARAMKSPVNEFETGPWRAWEQGRTAG